MKETSPGVLIIGGGVAGLEAARVLANFDVSVHVVEKNENLGGHAATWACMATAVCMNCGACLSIDLARRVTQCPSITTHLHTGVLKINKSESVFDVELENGENIEVRKIIAATGFSPFDPNRTGSYHSNRFKNVITTAQLNYALRNENSDEYFRGKSAPDIAFVQCVGSRNRKAGKDYCSQVCCKISMRQANRLLHAYPDANITVFYMDLQVIGKETRAFYTSLAGKTNLVQGVVAEILENPESEKLAIVTEDRENMKRSAREFDMVVLSTGMDPSDTMAETAGILGLTPNSWGFFNTDDALTADDIHVAGCARTPGDILTSMADGRIAAGRVADELDLLPKNAANDGKAAISVAVFGEGKQAVEAAEAIAANGYTTWLLGADAPKDTYGKVVSAKGAKILQIDGTAGNFTVSHELDGKRKSLSCAAVVAAFEPEEAPVDPGFSSKHIIAPEVFHGLAADSPEQLREDILILLDYEGQENKTWARTLLEGAIRAKNAGKNVFVAAQKILVHKADGQRLYDKARKAGITFLRYDHPNDVKIKQAGTGFGVAIRESTLPGSLEVTIECGCIILPPAVRPGAGFAQKAAALREKTDAEGFLQLPNVRHRISNSTRKGVFFAGTCHDEMDSDDFKSELNDIRTFLKSVSFNMPDMDSGVVINEKMCAKCLTCYRICPHAAIVLNEKMKPQIVADACFSCHLCVANCPAYAIESAAFSKSGIGEMAEKDRPVVFACERSAYLAASETDLAKRVKLVKIPCACRINADAILTALLNGASKVVVAGCHEGNCRSVDGSREAASGVALVQKIPGMDKTRAVFAPVAANEAAKINKIISI